MKIVIVTGMHRSGTSCIAGELANCGVPLSGHLLAGDEANPKGYFEDPALIALHEAMLSALGSNWMDPAPLASGWLELLEERGFVGELEKYLEQRHAEGLFLVKDPRISRLLPVWKRAAAGTNDEIVVLHVRRNCMDVANSLWRRNHIPILHALQLWARYNLDIEHNADGLKREVVDFDAFLKDPTLLAKAARKLAVKLAKPGNLGQFADATMRHTSQTNGAAAMTAAGIHTELLAAATYGTTDELRSLYEACGGDSVALERRHYAVIHSTLWTVVAEKRELQERVDRADRALQR